MNTFIYHVRVGHIPLKDCEKHIHFLKEQFEYGKDYICDGQAASYCNLETTIGYASLISFKNEEDVLIFKLTCGV
jgi:hypothetical protein